ncbi:DUF1659 domain-containing protein [Syntrophomonas wolfei]|uniref:DUF1659 domain-containing protein n=1 Tax=Syntrophomonas wolfei TaxID=863 RepID=UPI0023EF71FD|nr:DUF1659 domain-containing protein [Syntrophomonas wolfei]
MTVESRKFPSTLQLVYDLGTDDDGKKLSRRRSYSNVKSDAANQDKFDVAEAISGLQTYPVNQILVNDKTQLVNAE